MAAPAKDATAADIADWLELVAFLDEFKQARLDEALGSLKIQSDDTEVNTADADAEDDDVRADIETEIQRRERGLGSAYPFVLSAEGEVLRFKPADARCASSFYLLCLVLSHATRSPLLLVPPTGAALRDVRRRHFQVLATLATAGHASGHALSLGWPRGTGQSILAIVEQGCRLSGTGTARAAPGNLANPAAKDGGIDTLGWTPAPDDRPPPQSFCYGQAASGHQWRVKSARFEVAAFLRDYYDTPPQCNEVYVTVCPFLVDDHELQRISAQHGVVLDRTRAPKAALDGLTQAVKGHHVDEVANVRSLAKWLGIYRREARAAA